MWIDEYTSSFTSRSREDDRVLEVVPVPGHERHEHVAAERQLAAVGGGAVGDDLARGHPLAELHQRAAG